MKRPLATLGFLASILGNHPVYAENPKEWFERCVAGAENEIRMIFQESECQDHVIVYCTYSTDPSSCFATLREGYLARTEAIVSLLPNSVHINLERQEFYTNTLGSLNGLGPQIKCSPKFTGLACEIDAMMHSHRLATILRHLADQSKDKE